MCYITICNIIIIYVEVSTLNLCLLPLILPKNGRQNKFASSIDCYLSIHAFILIIFFPVPIHVFFGLLLLLYPSPFILKIYPVNWLSSLLIHMLPHLYIYIHYIRTLHTYISILSTYYVIYNFQKLHIRLL